MAMKSANFGTVSLVNVEKLKLHAQLLETALAEFDGHSSEVDFLRSYQPLLGAISEAKRELTLVPVDLGLGRWELESRIREVPSVLRRLMKFELLIRYPFLLM